LRNSRLKVAVTMSNPQDEGWPGFREHIDKAFLESAVPHIASQRVHLCGPPPMITAVKNTLSELGVPDQQIKREAFGTITRDPAAKTVSARAVAGRVTFQMSQASAAILTGATILDAADEAGVFIDNACRSGTCGACRIKLLSGKVHMPIKDSLTEEEKARGYILACQAQAEGDVVVES
jgi:ferredoxin